MNKIRIEHREGDVWKGIQTKVSESRRGNLYAKYHTENGDGTFQEHVLVWKDMKHGTPVVEKIEGKWVQVGRIVHGDIFLGEGQSYSEYRESPEALEASRKMLESLREKRFPKMNQPAVKKFEFPTEV